MRRGRLDVVVQFHVRQLVAANDAFLVLHGQRVPARHVVQVLLHQDVAAAGEFGVFVADHGEIDGLAPFGIFSAVDKTDDGAPVEVAKAMDFIDHGHRIAQAVDQQGRQFKAKVHGVRADVQQQIARRGHGHARAPAEPADRLQGRGARRADQRGPGGGPECTDA
ncbi:hypothetical protein G6F31_018300 [Rhizopus arrhizus]|nr:hypothetical protein G6F31_018300 [Rhizopus arrhizus]